MIGIDEVGRGCWAGPMVACAVDLRVEIEGLSDSKKLTPKKRLEMSTTIKQQAAQIGIGWVSAREIDDIGLNEANRLAMQRAINQIETSSSIIIDGHINYLKELENAEAVVDADDTHPEVMAASIVAKVARDQYMQELDKALPGYEFARHKGYGTKLHAQHLDKIGISVVHRSSFAPIAKYLH